MAVLLGVNFWTTVLLSSARRVAARFEEIGYALRLNDGSRGGSVSRHERQVRHCVRRRVARRDRNRGRGTGVLGTPRVRTAGFETAGAAGVRALLALTARRGTDSPCRGGGPVRGSLLSPIPRGSRQCVSSSDLPCCWPCASPVEPRLSGACSNRGAACWVAGRRRGRWTEPRAHPG